MSDCILHDLPPISLTFCTFAFAAVKVKIGAAADRRRKEKSLSVQQKVARVLKDDRKKSMLNE